MLSSSGIKRCEFTMPECPYFNSNVAKTVLGTGFALTLGGSPLSPRIHYLD